MTTHPSVTSVPAIPDFDSIELEPRERIIADILTAAARHDRALKVVERAVDARLGGEWYQGSYGRFQAEVLVQKPHQISDAFTGMRYSHAQLAAALYPAAAQLADQALAFDPEWDWCEWSPERQEQTLRSFFARAGIAERYVPRGLFLEEQS